MRTGIALPVGSIVLAVLTAGLVAGAGCGYGAAPAPTSEPGASASAMATVGISKLRPSPMPEASPTPGTSTPGAPATPAVARSDVKMGPVPIDQTTIRAWQEAADDGRETWRTDPVQVVRAEGTALGFSLEDDFRLVDWFASPSSGTWHVTVRAVHEGRAYDVRLLQPGVVGSNGIWTINDVGPADLQPPLRGVAESVRAYFGEADPRDVPGAVERFNQLPMTALGLPAGGFKRAAVADAPSDTHMRLVIVSFSSRGDLVEGSLVLWWAGQGMRYQVLDLQPGGLVTQARLVVSSGGAELGLVYDSAFGGSAPYLHYELLRLGSAGWEQVWGSPGTGWRGMHGKVTFVGRGLETLKVRSSSWMLDDPKSALFWELNPGPHRYFEDTWTRQGDAYECTATAVMPSAYATLVELVYSLSIGDESSAASLVSDPNLVGRAKQMGLIQRPLGARWLIDLASPEVEEDGPIVIVQGPAVKLTFTRVADRVLVAAIDGVAR